MDTTFVDSVIALLQSGKWIAGTVVVLGYLVRLLQSDTALPFTLPTKWRVAVEMVLALVSGLLAQHLNGLTWTQTLVWTALTGMLLVTGRTTITEILGNEPSFLVPLKKVGAGVVGTGSAKIDTPVEVPIPHNANSVYVKKDETTKP
jgi:hypothetical protein